MRIRGICISFVVLVILVPSKFYCYRLDFELWGGTYHLTNTYFKNYNVKIVDEIEMRSLGISIVDEDAFVNMTKLKYLHLNYNNIIHLPAHVFSNLTSLEQLNLKCNELQAIEASLFKNLTELTFIDLSRNNIQKIDKKLFKDLIKLEFLYLNQNQISVIEVGTFDNNLQLKYIDLYHNKLTELKNGTFTILMHLERLYLNVNNIKFVETNALPINSSLNEVTLYINNLQYLDHNIILNLKTLEYLSLFNNPWNCDIKLKKLVHASKHLLPGSQTFFEIPSCTKPKRLENRKWNTLTDKDFPYVSTSTVQNASLGDKVILSCRAANVDYEADASSIEWLYEDNTPVLEGYGRLVSFKYVHQSGEVWNNLTILSAQQEDAHEYKCVLRTDGDIMEEESLQLSLGDHPLVSDAVTGYDMPAYN